MEKAKIYYRNELLGRMLSANYSKSSIFEIMGYIAKLSESQKEQTAKEIIQTVECKTEADVLKEIRK